MPVAAARKYRAGFSPARGVQRQARRIGRDPAVPAVWTTRAGLANRSILPPPVSIWWGAPIVQHAAVDGGGVKRIARFHLRSEGDPDSRC